MKLECVSAEPVAKNRAATIRRRGLLLDVHVDVGHWYGGLCIDRG